MKESLHYKLIEFAESNESLLNPVPNEGLKELMTLYNLTVEEAAVFAYLLKLSFERSYVEMENFESDDIKRGDRNYLKILGSLRKLQSKGIILLEGRRRKRGDNFNPGIQIDDFVFSKLVLGEDTYDSVDFTDVYSILETAEFLIDRKTDHKIGEERFFSEFDTLCEKMAAELPLTQLITNYQPVERVMLMKACVSTLKGGRRDDLNEFVSDIFESLRSVARVTKKIYEGKMPIFKDKILRLVEGGGFFSQMGQPDFELTEKAYDKIFDTVSKRKKSELKTHFTEYVKHKNINKELYFDDELKIKVDTIASALDGKRFKEVTAKLKQNGFAPGMVSLLYGYPGTGKTATVHQVAKMTRRDVLQVDISNINDKYVGESEKRLKEVFNEYRKAKKILSRTPILLFNESDALIGKRIEVTDSVDQMSNNMQNILLEELEKFEGIFFATTNLTQNMDDAFSRRFLYKIEFTKPSFGIRKKIWESKMKEIPSDWTDKLSSYELTGGQIDNIVRKYMIDSILLNKTGLDEIKKMCGEEINFKKQTAGLAIGFGKRK